MAKKNSAVDDDGITAGETAGTIDTTTDDTTEPAVVTEAAPETVPAATAPETVPAATAADSAAPDAEVIDEHSAAPEHSAAEPDLDDVLPEKDPGKVLGIVGLVVGLGLGVIGFVLGLLSYRKSRAVGYGGGFGMAAMILGIITTVLLGLQLTLMASGMGIGGACDGRAPGVHTLDNGTTISCR